MSGHHAPPWARPEDVAALESIRSRALEGYAYADRLPSQGLSMDGRPALTGLDPAAVGRYVVLSVRDPLAGQHGKSHAERIASAFGPATSAGASSLFTAFSAPVGDEVVTVIETGSGSPELELVLVEVMQHTDAEVLIYFGTAAGLHPYVHPGDVVVPTGIVRGEAMTQAYVDVSYPAVPSYDVVAAFAEGGNDAGAQVRTGIVRSTDSDILGNGRPSVGGYLPPSARGALDYWVSAGVLCNDRESSAVVVLGSLFGRRTGAVLAVTDNYPAGRPLQVGAGVDNALATLVRGITALAEANSAPR